MRRLRDIKIKGLNVRNTARFCVAMLALVLSVVIFAKVAPLFSPLIAAFLISVALEPPVKQLIKRIKIKRVFAGSAVIIVLLAIVFLILWAVTVRLVREFNAYLTRLPENLESLYGNLEAFVDRNSGILDWLPFQFTIDFGSMIDGISEWGSNYAQDFAGRAVRNALSTAASVPVGILFVATMMLSTFFIIMDRERHAAFILRNVPQKWLDSVDKLRDGMFAALLGYVRAQLIIMLVMFVILLAGLSIARVSNALAISFLTALFDALPVFGIAMILLPWAAYAMLTGDVFLCVTLVVLCVVCTSARRLIEPKILSTSVGADPLMTVTSMFLGFRLFGFAGVITGPIIYIVVRAVALEILDGRSFKEYFLLEGEL